MSCTLNQWSAKATGGLIHVEGKGMCTSSGHELELERIVDGVVNDPDVMTFRLSIKQPDFSNPVITPAIATWSGPLEETASRVAIHIPGGDTVAIPIEKS